MYVHFGADGTAALTDVGRDRVARRVSHTSPSTAAADRRRCYDDLLIVNCDGNGDDAFVVALDTRTGKIRWKTCRRSPADQAYSTPLVIRVGDRDAVVSVGAYRARRRTIPQPARRSGA